MSRGDWWSFSELGASMVIVDMLVVVAVIIALVVYSLRPKK